MKGQLIKSRSSPERKAVGSGSTPTLQYCQYGTLTTCQVGTCGKLGNQLYWNQEKYRSFIIDLGGKHGVEN